MVISIKKRNKFITMLNILNFDLASIASKQTKNAKSN